MIIRAFRWLALLAAVAVVTFALGTLSPAVSALAQELAVDPRTASPTPADLRPGFRPDPDPNKTSSRETAGIQVYEAAFVRDRTTQNMNNGPIEVTSLVARTANSQQAAEQFNGTRQYLLTAEPPYGPWSEATVAKLGDESAGLTMKGNLDNQPGIAHRFLLRRGSMVVLITVLGLEKSTKMAEAEAIAATVLKKFDPSVATARGTTTPRQLRTPPAGTGQAGSTGSGQSGSTGTTQPAGATTTAPPAPTPPRVAETGGGGARVRVANTDRQGVNLRASPSTTAQVRAVIPEGTVLDVIGEDSRAENRTWKNVRTSSGATGWVAAEFTTSVAASGPSGGAAAAATPSPSATPAPAASGPAATTSAPPSASSPPPPPPPSSPPSAAGQSSPSPSSGQLQVAVEPQVKSLQSGTQTVVITVTTSDGRPVANANATISVSYSRDSSSESVPAGPTNAEGKVTISWEPKGPAGSVGVGVAVVAPDGASGAGGASFTKL